MSSRPPFEPTKKKRSRAANSKPSSQGSARQSKSANSRRKITSQQKSSKSTQSEQTEQASGSPQRAVGQTAEAKRISPDERAIPEVVSQRMIQRIAICSGVPLFMAMGTFVGSYFVVMNDLFPLPNTAVLLTSLGWFGLSVVGVSYGVLSSSWDEEIEGSRLGIPEFRLNLGRTWASIKEARQIAKEKRQKEK
ncbi:MAG: PAM68 family protein [Microcoleaceae cyanobacterium]